PLDLALGLLAGVAAAIGTAFGCEHFDRSVKSSDEVEGLLQLPTLAAIPNFHLVRDGRGHPTTATGRAPADDADPDLVVHRAPRSVIAEAFRSLRSAVLFSTPEAPPKVILVTSAGAGEGKTVVCLNLATALAVPAEPGLSSVLTGQADVARATHALDAPRIAVIPAGPPPPNPAELVSS